MRADVDFTGGGLDVTFRIDLAGLTPALAAMLQFQLVRLKLNDRYPRQINKFLSEQRTAMLLFKELGLPPAELAAYLLRSAASLGGNFGHNDWRPALLEALAANEMFCATPEAYLGARPHAEAQQVVT
jgi:hypothetical protein